MPKALTLHQPWATLVVASVKTIETRSRRMNYRGRLPARGRQGLWNLDSWPEVRR